MPTIYPQDYSLYLWTKNISAKTVLAARAWLAWVFVYKKIFYAAQMRNERAFLFSEMARATKKSREE